MTNIEFLRYLLFKKRKIHWIRFGLVTLILVGFCSHLYAVLFCPEYYRTQSNVALFIINLAGFFTTVVIPVSYTFAEKDSYSVTLNSKKILIESCGVERFLNTLDEQWLYKHRDKVIIRLGYSIYGQVKRKDIILKGEMKNEI